MKLTITCDDFGESRAANQGIMEAFQTKLIDQASLMVDRPGSSEAIDLTHRHHVPVGLHFWLGASVGQAVANSFSPRRVENELVKQMAAIRALQPRHFDSHFHVHLLPWVASIIEKKVSLPIRGARVAVGPSKASLIGLFAHRFPTVDYLVDLDWWPKLSSQLVRSIFSQIPDRATVEVIVHPQAGKSLEWLLKHGPLHRYTRL